MFRITSLILLFFCTYSESVVSQPIYKHWDARFGGNLDESPGWFDKTPDGGLIIGGTSISGISGDKTQSNWDPNNVGSDFWLVRTDSNGTKLWDRRFGGINSEVLIKVRNTSDGGFIAGGHSFSGISGDKTQPNWDASQQTYDYWLIKLNGNGIKQWDKRFGGNTLELFGSVVQTSDGGYFVAGSSFSGISGDKTQDSRGSWDYWTLRLDASGNKLWDKRYGSTDDEFATAADTVAGGGFIIAGYSQSPAGGDNSQYCQGQWDYWILKIDAQGNKVWDKTYGGNYTDWLFDAVSTSDGGFLLGGQSFSDATGDKSEPNYDPTPATSDRWIIKLDSNGNKVWDHVFGGTETDDLSRIDESPSGYFLLSGESYSPISGTKTETNLGIEQTWTNYIDAAGNNLWNKTIFSSAHDEKGTGIMMNEHCFITVNYSLADTGGYKTQPSRGDGDYWIVKVCDYVNTTGIQEAVVTNPENIIIYPNPVTNGLVNIKTDAFATPTAQLFLYDINGKKVFSEVIINAGQDGYSVDISAMKSGLYLLNMISENKVYRAILTK